MLLSTDLGEMGEAMTSCSLSETMALACLLAGLLGAEATSIPSRLSRSSKLELALREKAWAMVLTEHTHS